MSYPWASVGMTDFRFAEIKEVVVVNRRLEEGVVVKEPRTKRSVYDKNVLESFGIPRDREWERTARPLQATGEGLVISN